MLITMSEIIGLVTLILLSIYTVFLFVVGRKKQIKNILLALFLLVNVLYLLGFLTPAINNFFQIDLLWFGYYGYATGFLFGPTLYLYTRSITEPKFTFSPKQFFHAVPFLLELLNLLFFRVFMNMEYFLFMHFQIVIYLYFCLRFKKQYVKRISEFYSSIEKINLTWLEVVIYAFALMWIIDVILLTVFETSIVHSYAVFVSVLINFAFASMLFIQSLKHPEILSGVNDTKSKSKYEYSNLSEMQKREYLQKLESICEKEKPYLSSNLTLDELSSISGIPTRYISQVINESLSKNFYDFVNHYRIEGQKES